MRRASPTPRHAGVHNDERQPGMRCLTTGLSSPFVDLVVTTAVRSEWGLRTRSCTAWRVGSPPPQGPSLRSGLPVRRRLIGPIRPTRGHIAISPHGGLYGMPSVTHFEG